MKRLGIFKRPGVISASIGLFIGLALSASVTSLAAQSVAKAASSVPRVSVRGATGLRSLVDDAGVALTVDRDAYVTVFALAPGQREAPLAVLSPVSPSASPRLVSGRRYRTLPLRSPELLRLVSTGTPQVIVAFSSTVAPNLAPFRAGSRWATDLVLTDSMAVGTSQLVRAMAHLLYGDAAFQEAIGGKPTYRVVVQSLSEGAPLNRYTGFPSTSECLTEVSRLSWSPALEQTGGMSVEQRPLGNGDGGCAGISVDWIAPAPSALYGRSPAANAGTPSGAAGLSGSPNSRE